MANKYVITGSTDLSAAASWDGAALPSAGDTGYIMDGNQTILTGLTAVALNRLVVASGFRGKIGTSSTVVSFRVDNGTAPKMEILGGEYHNVAAHTTGGITTLVVQTPAEVYLGGTGTVTNLKVKAGYCEVGAGAVVTNAYNFGGVLYAYDNATALTILSSHAGRTTTKRDVTTLTADGESFTVVMNDGTSATAVTTANVGGNSTLNHQSRGTVGTLNMFGRGNYTPAGAIQDTVVTTINNYSLGKLVAQAGPIRLTYTTLNDFAERGTITDQAGLFGVD